MKIRTFLSILICSTSLGFAEAHEGFDPHCCNGDDCQPIVSILETTGGDLVVTLDGNSAVFAKNHPRRKSPDGESYACIGPNNTPRCLYIPDLGS